MSLDLPARPRSANLYGRQRKATSIAADEVEGPEGEVALSDGPETQEDRVNYRDHRPKDRLTISHESDPQSL